MSTKKSIADFIFEQEEDHEEFRDSISTVDEQGKRLWIYPKKPQGYFHPHAGLRQLLFAGGLVYHAIHPD